MNCFHSFKYRRGPVPGIRKAYGSRYFHWFKYRHCLRDRSTERELRDEAVSLRCPKIRGPYDDKPAYVPRCWKDSTKKKRQWA